MADVEKLYELTDLVIDSIIETTRKRLGASGVIDKALDIVHRTGLLYIGFCGDRRICLTALNPSALIDDLVLWTYLCNYIRTESGYTVMIEMWNPEDTSIDRVPVNRRIIEYFKKIK